MSQEQGFVGKLVGAMVRRSVRSGLRNLYWQRPETLPPSPIILYANHHGWLDGYLMFHVITELGVRCVDWIEEFDSFPLFSQIGGMRFTRGDVAQRVKTVRQTIRLMLSENRSLLIFPEGILHRPSEIFPFGRSLQTVASRVPNATMIPVAIYYELSMHERPEAWISFGAAHKFDSLEACEERLRGALQQLRQNVSSGHEFEILAKGTPSVNERMSMKRFRKP